MNISTLIGLVGPSGAGKTTIAKHLTEKHGYSRLHMGQPIKDMLAVLGLSGRELNGPPQVRAAPSKMLGGKSPRHAMQTLGTDWGRRMVSKTIWSDHLSRRLVEMQNRQIHRVIVDDLRFPEDFSALRKAGGIIIRVVRTEAETVVSIGERFSRLFPGLRQPLRAIGLQVEHDSETHWRTAWADLEIMNDSSVESAARELLSKLGSLNR